MPEIESHQRGLQLYEAGQLARAQAAFSEAAIEYRSAGDLAMAGEMLNNVGVVQRGLKEWEAALAAVEAALTLFRELNDRQREAQALGNLGSIRMEMNDLDEAGKALSEAVEIYNELDEREERGFVLNLLGQVRIKQGRHYDGLLDLEAGLADREQLSGQQRWLKKLLKLPAKLLRGL